MIVLPLSGLVLHLQVNERSGWTVRGPTFFLQFQANCLPIHFLYEQVQVPVCSFFLPPSSRCNQPQSPAKFSFQQTCTSLLLMKFRAT